MMKHTLFSLSILVLCNSCGDRKEEANIRDLSEVNNTMRLCQNSDTAFFYAQSPDFLKPGLCYYPKYSYL